MQWIPIALALAIGFALGLLVAFALRIVHGRAAEGLAREIIKETEEEKKAALNRMLGELKASFGDLSFDALRKSTEEFLKLAKARLQEEREVSAKELEAKKALIDAQLKKMNTELENVSVLVRDLEKDRAEKFSQLATQLKASQEQVSQLLKTTNALREALASTKARGQWGERMAEDVLRVAGFVENVNYLKQKAVAGAGTRPDFTFLLPKDLKLNMDVKFPLDNYLRFLEADTDIEKQQFKNNFLRDVKARIKEITTRDYINPEQNTLDYVLLFIPNEQVYSFIQEQDASIAQEALKNKVVICSPITLFAILAVIRQAVDNFALEKTSGEILGLLGTFKKQWEAFLAKLEILGKRIEDTRKEYDLLMTTRKRQLEKPLNRLDELRESRALPAALEDSQEEPNER
ncbi:MAG: DNA recombination protein RmuC [Deltaproteobacteria bacterium]|nr:DNA recombination protein RmuC [Deltaproteobacteria bacterium]MBW2083361.1 DNA recombination protein RmuC [Deltaproteobacteria bacterium]HDM10450.1 DNA recombination protein RmuC [Desulfobacteraceae bacterium]